MQRNKMWHYSAAAVIYYHAEAPVAVPNAHRKATASGSYAADNA